MVLAATLAAACGGDDSGASDSTNATNATHATDASASDSTETAPASTDTSDGASTGATATTAGGPTSATSSDPTGETTSASGSTGETDAGTTGETGEELYAPPYDPGFAVNRPIPDGVASDPCSDAIVAQLALNVSQTKVAVATHGEVPGLYTVSEDDPLYDVDAGESLSGIQFRVPPEAQSGGGSDDPITILDPLSPEFGPFTELRMWEVDIDHDAMTLTASAAGLFHYNNDGALLNPDDSPSLARPFMGWGTGSGLSYYAGLVHHAEVDQDVIPHAIRFSYSCAHSSDQFRAPATKTDQPHPICGGNINPDADFAMDMGMRLQLDPAVDCDARTTPAPDGSDGVKETRFLRMFCRALQDYGMIMLDGTGPGGLVIYMENDLTAGWIERIGLEQWDSHSYIVRDQTTPDDGFARGPSDGIPWGQLRVLETSVFP